MSDTTNDYLAPINADKHLKMLWDYFTRMFTVKETYLPHLAKSLACLHKEGGPFHGVEVESNMEPPHSNALGQMLLDTYLVTFIVMDEEPIFLSALPWTKIRQIEENNVVMKDGSIHTSLLREESGKVAAKLMEKAKKGEGEKSESAD